MQRVGSRETEVTWAHLYKGEMSQTHGEGCNHTHCNCHTTMKISDKVYVMTTSMTSIIWGKSFLLGEEIINCVFQCKMHGGCIGFHIKLIRLFQRENFATLHR